jgi:uncharacterized protein YjiK
MNRMLAFFIRNLRQPVVAITLFILTAFSALYLFRIDSLAWYFWHNNKHQDSGENLKLRDYQVVLDGRAVPGLTDASGLTYNTSTHTLFTVLNQSPYIVELSLDGQVLRRILVEGVGDMEGITYVAGNRFVIADEGDNRVIEVEIPPYATVVQTRHFPQLKLGLDEDGNQNIEGVSWDSVNQRLLIVKEKNPKRLLEVRGFIEPLPSNPGNLSIVDLDRSKRAIGAMRDLSSVTYHDDSGHFLLLSDESRLIKEYDRQGRAVSAMALWKGFHGLRKHVPQAEGIAVGPDKRIYIMSEPNLLYVFRPIKRT